MLESNASDYYERFSNDIGLYYINLIKHSENQDIINEYKAKSFDFFEKAFKMNQTKATINNYGICFMIGIGVSKNIEKAKEIFQIGISKGDINIQYHYDFILENENPEKSHDYYKEIADKTHHCLQFHHALINEDQKEFNKSIQINLQASNNQNFLNNDYLKSIELLAKKYSIENDTENTYKYMNILIKCGNSIVPIEYAIQLYKKKNFIK